jgi:hypothetical protein
VVLQMRGDSNAGRGELDYAEGETLMLTSYDMTRLRQIAAGIVVLSGWAATRLIDAGLLLPKGTAYAITPAGWAALKGAP